jgi:stress-induced-phosphoprotein 1
LPLHPQYKALGNACLQKQDFDGAIKNYTAAINADGTNHVYYSNRSAAYLSKKEPLKALDDAEACIGLNPGFAKGYSRKGAALHTLKRFNDAIAAYDAGLDKAPGDAGLTKGRAEAVRDKDAPPASANPMANLFGPSLIAKIAADPKCAPYLDDQSFMQKLQMLQTNPNSLQMMMGDPRIMEVLQLALGGNVQFKDQNGDEVNAPPPAATKKQEKKEPEPEPEVDTSDFSEEELAAHNQKKAAVAKKNEGNELYKAKDFGAAIIAYDEAIALDPKNMTFVSNKAAVYFTQRKWDECIAICDEAFAVGKEHFAPYEDKAKALTRKGKAYQMKGELATAIEIFKESLLEHQDKATERLLKTLELEKRKADTLAYQNPELAEEAKQRGNDFFREREYGPAVTAYEEAVKRSPKDAPIRNNLAAALCKLMDFNGAKKHVDVALEIDPKYVKAWARKGDIAVLMKENHKALEAYRKGLALEPENKACMEGAMKVTQMINAGSANMTDEEKKERAAHGMADPEIQNILTDPVIRQVLQDFNDNPSAAQAAMRDPGVSSKIEKLIAAGVVQTA